MTYRRWNDRQKERTERWQREDDAHRLLTEVPHLRTLKLNIEERRATNFVPGTRYTQHIIVARAAARFEVPCSEPKCQEGGHDITDEMLRGLQSREAHITGTSTCNGTVGDNPCGRVMEFVAEATYAPAT